MAARLKEKYNKEIKQALKVGTEKAVGLMASKLWDEDLLKDLSQAMADASICGLGQAAPNPIACVLKYFPRELRDSIGSA